jgi:hypothetical protein
MFRRCLFITVLLSASSAAQPGWWMREPIRWLQTNLRETDAVTPPAALAAQAAGFHANVLLLNAGGIVAQYRSALPYHHPSPHLPPGGELFGPALAALHERKIRVVARFDFSKTVRRVYDAEPEWFFRKADGSPVVYNGLYSTCINSGYYSGYALRVLDDFLERYPVDGLFFNMFGNQSRDYSGNFVGHCHCGACRRLYRERFAKDLPREPDEDYRRFMFESSRRVAAEIGKLIARKRPGAGYFNYIQEWTDGIMSESNTAVTRPLPLWPYASSDNVNRARNSEPGKMSVNLCMQFVDYPWRFATVPAGEITLRLWQNVAHGGAAAFAVNGTLEQQDRQAVEAARPVFEWLARNEQYFSGQQSEARVILLGQPGATGRSYSQASYRGLFRLLSEAHIPFAVADNLNWIGKRPVGLVVAADWAPPELAGYLRSGGRVLVASARPPEFPTVQVVRRASGVQTYVRVRAPELFPSLKSTSLLLLNGDFTETAQPAARAALTLVSDSMFGPPEYIHIDQKDTDTPAIVESEGGRAVWLPWDLGGLYYRHSLTAHAGLFRDLAARLLPEPGLRTNAHPLVELTLMRQGARRLVHLVNLSGTSGTAYFPAVPMRDIRVEVTGAFRSARAVRLGRALPVTGNAFVLPSLSDYELVVLE